jgi:very-short-patch-repair endonuclease
VDFLFRAHSLVVETDGRRHHTSATYRSVDRARTDRMEASGYRVLRLTWGDVVLRPAATARRIRSRLVSAEAVAGIPVTPRR